MEIVFYDNDVVVCKKLAGELSEGESERSLPVLISSALLEKGERNCRVFVVHRLDKETVGLIVFARNERAAAALSESVRDGKLTKEYLAVCHGTPTERSARLCDLLYYDRGRGKSFVVDRSRAGVKRAELEYEVIASNSELSLLKILLFTGRTHQIRVQFASRKHPLCGDRRYGAPKSECSSVALLSRRLCFPHPSSGEQMSFELPRPDEYPWNIF